MTLFGKLLQSLEIKNLQGKSLQVNYWEWIRDFMILKKLKEKMF